MPIMICAEYGCPRRKECTGHAHPHEADHLCNERCELIGEGKSFQPRKACKPYTQPRNK
jgi:hypothetical protein